MTDSSTELERAPAPVEVTVLIPTRDRQDELKLAIDSILASTFTNFELVIVAQGQTDAIEAEVRRVAANDTRVRVVCDSAFGSSRARNVGIQASSGSLIAFTDDDCAVSPDWLSQVVAEFRADPNLGAACGAVIAGPHDSSAGFIVGYVPKRRERMVGRLAKLREAGIGANMAFRRQAIDVVGGWDECLGAGSAFNGSGDFDLVYRVLGAGFVLLQMPGAYVVHHGFRNWEAGTSLIRGRYRGIGGAYCKHLRLGDPVAALLILQQVWLAGANLIANLVGGRRPLGVGRLAYLMLGIRESFGYRIDPKTKRYIPKANARLS
jgi:glycosyltransferase involved in cell wall biosynthesis